MKRLIYASTKLSSYIDTSTTGVSYYDDFLNSEGLKYLENNKNRTGEIVMMSPTEYYNECANNIFDSTFDRLVNQRRHDKDTIEWMYDQIDSGNKMKLPYINYANSGQEGLHRMMALGDKFGWDSKFPVLVVTVYNSHAEDLSERYRYLKKAVDEAVKYQYPRSKLIEYFKSQLDWELEDYLDEVPEEVLLSEYDDKMVVSLAGYEDDINIQIYYDDLRLTDDEADVDDYIENVDDADIDLFDF